jgi:hypothetical protein
LKHLILVFIALFAIVGAAYAKDGYDDQGNPNDPSTNDRANDCYDGGTMAGRCETDLEWQAGWYLIRFEHGLMKREEIPSWVAWVLPPEIAKNLLPADSGTPVTPIPVPSVGCTAYYFSQYMDFGGGYFLPAGSTVYQLNSCTTPVGTSSTARVYAPAGFDALTLCKLNGSFSSATPPPFSYGVYDCNP